MGEVFGGRYELLEPIAEGGMGSVWQVRDHQDGQIKAAKLLRHSDAGSLLRFIREQSTRIHHTHVVTPLSWVGEDDAVLFTMPLVRGGSVASLVGDWGALPETWVATVLDQTLSALEAVHEAGVVHRDVKPANLLLEPTGWARPHVRLTDFGIAAPMDQPRMTTSSNSLGTPGYVAPEQRAGADPDPRQDLFSVAVVGLEMLLGHPPPFSTDELPTTALGGLLAGARNPDPERRPPDASSFRDALRPMLPPTWEPGSIEVLDQFQGAGPVAEVATAATSVLPREDRATSEPRAVLAGASPTGRGARGPGARSAPAPSRGEGRAAVLVALVGLLLVLLSVVLLLR